MCSTLFNACDLVEPLNSSLPTRGLLQCKMNSWSKKTLLSKGIWVVEAPGILSLNISASR